MTFKNTKFETKSPIWIEFWGKVETLNILRSQKFAAVDWKILNFQSLNLLTHNAFEDKCAAKN